MKYEDTIVDKPDYVYEKGVIEIPYVITYDKNNPNSFTGSGKLGKNMGLASHGKSIEELKKRMNDAFNASIEMYEIQTKRLNRRALWLGNFKKHEKGFAFWFSSLGLGLNLVYLPDRKFPVVDKNKKPIKFIGISRAGGLVIKHLIVFGINNWKSKNKVS